MISFFDQKLVDQLVEKGVITLAQAKEIASKAEKGEELPKLFSSMGIVEEKWVPLKGELFNMPIVDLSEKDIKRDVLDFIPKDLAENYRMVPFFYDKDKSELKIAMMDPGNFKAMEAVEFLARKKGFHPRYYIVSPSGFRRVLKQYDTLGSEVEQVLHVVEEEKQKKEEDEIKEEKKPIQEVIKSAPVSKMVDLILKHAVEAKASDVHIEPIEKNSIVRYRIDGILHTSLILPKQLHNSLVSRIKVLANLKIDETRVPQDGRVRITVHKKNIDLRVSTMPLFNIEKVVIRILDTSGGKLTFEQLGFTGKNLKYVKENIRKATGMFLVTGPTGSGKSTTLYSALNMVNDEAVNIVTLEDPIEYYLEGVNQSQVNPDVGYTFANGLRSILRQDPDIIMVGEIRDSETAELAIHAALTGHMVLSTLHTNDALGALPRLIDMHVEPFLIASTVNLVVAQRLVRHICEHCKEKIELPERIVNIARKILETTPQDALPKSLDTDHITFYRGAGCARCGDSGYKGRLAIVETLLMTDNLRTIITSNQIEKMHEEFLKQGVPSMRQDGILKVLTGQTTMEEVMKATK